MAAAALDTSILIGRLSRGGMKVQLPELPMSGPSP